MSNENNNPFEQSQNNNQQYYQAPPQGYYNQYNPNIPPMPPQEEKASVGLAIISYIIPLVGLILYLSEKDSKPKTAKACGKCALASVIINIVITVVIYAVMGTALFSGISKIVDETADTSHSEYNEVTSNSDNTASEQPNDGTIGDYKCVVKKAEKYTDYTGKDAILITYEFTNNSNKNTFFDMALYAKAYQGGVNLDTTYIDAETNTFTEIKPGVTIEVQEAYALRDTTTEIEIEISELISLSDDKIVTKVTLQ